MRQLLRRKKNNVWGTSFQLVIKLAVIFTLPIIIIFSSKTQMVRAQPDDLGSAAAKYPNIVGSVLQACGLCHTGSIPDLNLYGAAYLDNGRSTAAFGLIENLDSDGDGFTNIQEISALTFPGNPASFPSNATSTPTATSVPATATPTATSVPATATPTATSAPATATPTATSAAPATATPTATSVPATATPTATPGSAIASFSDVPLTYWAWNSIERLYDSGISGGCGISPLVYCPVAPVTRAQMAIFLVRAMHGVAFIPPTAKEIFTDVPADSFGADYIEQLYADGITSGCGAGKYCPSRVVTRAQLAIFLVRVRHGLAFVPPTATGIFVDVPVGSFGANYIEQLVADAITSGCGGSNYCPNITVKRDSMAVFLVKTFNLP